MYDKIFELGYKGSPTFWQFEKDFKDKGIDKEYYEQWAEQTKRIAKKCRINFEPDFSYQHFVESGEYMSCLALYIYEENLLTSEEVDKALMV